MTWSAEDVSDANAQFWNLVSALRAAERADPADPRLADLYEDAEYLRVNGITSGIRERCGRLVAEWHARDGGGGLRAPRRPGDRELA